MSENNNNNTSTTLYEMKNKLHELIDQSGVVNDVKAKIRTQFILHLLNKVPINNNTINNKFNTIEDKYFISFLYHSLIKIKLIKTLQVFIAETGFESKNSFISEIETENYYKIHPIFPPLHHHHQFTNNQNTGQNISYNDNSIDISNDNMNNTHNSIQFKDFYTLSQLEKQKQIEINNINDNDNNRKYIESNLYIQTQLKNDNDNLKNEILLLKQQLNDLNNTINNTNINTNNTNKIRNNNDNNNEDNNNDIKIESNSNISERLGI
jgi:hypothetical protein